MYLIVFSSYIATTEEALLEHAIKQSVMGSENMVGGASGFAGSTVSAQSVSDMVIDSPANVPDIAAMTEEEQVAYAMQMSLQPGINLLHFLCLNSHNQKHKSSANLLTFSYEYS